MHNQKTFPELKKWKFGWKKNQKPNWGFLYKKNFQKIYYFQKSNNNAALIFHKKPPFS